MKNFLGKIFLLRREADPSWPQWKRTVYHLYPPVLLSCAGFCMGLALLVLAVGPYSKRTLLGYLAHWEIVAFNTIPVILLALLFYGLTGKAWSAFLCGGGICLGFSLGNYFKLQFRDDPLYFEDMLNLREAQAMAGGGHYQLFIDAQIITAVFCLLLGGVLLWMLAPSKAKGWKLRLPAPVAAVAAAACIAPLYLDADIYNSIANFERLNQWSATQNYISRGFLYPFIHSVADFVETPPAGYSQAKAQNLLSAYQDAGIPADRKINVIAIMREAYADFSRYGIEGLDPAAYHLYHQLEAESYTGDLVTNIFAGGTIDTERCFLTGNYQLKNFRGNTNSYLWYFRSQGYTVEGSHPYYQWFYNRQNINGYIGFERYRFLEGDYEKLTQAILPEDSILYPEVYKDFQANKDTGKPYFSFVLNVQSHGPYSTSGYEWMTHLTGDYSDACKSAVNHYLSSITEGDAELMKLVEQLRADPEPVVLVTFGDHLPWMGDGNVFYEEMGMDIDPGTDEGFYTHYSTRYLIWANDAAKTLLGHDVAGEGPAISPCYLMNLVFQQMGWEGPAYLQAMDDFMEVFPIATTNNRYRVDGVLTSEIPEERRELFQNFQYLQHYWRHEFLYGGLLSGKT